MNDIVKKSKKEVNTTSSDQSDDSMPGSAIKELCSEINGQHET